MAINSIIDKKRLTWLDVVNPTSEDLDQLQEQFGFHDLAMDDCFSRMQRPKIDEYPDHIFVVMHFPRFNKEQRRISSEQVSVFLGKRYIVTVHTGMLKSIDKLARECQVLDNQSLLVQQGAAHLFYMLVDRLVDYCFPILDKMSINLEKLEQEIFAEMIRDSVRDVTIIRRNILNFRKIIGTQRRLISNLEHKHHSIFPSHLDIFFDDIMDHIEKIWQTLENQRELIEGLGDTNESLINHRTNEVIKILTIFSVVMLPLSLISGMWGMNINLPFENHASAFYVILALMGAIIVIMFYFFRKKKWI